MSELYDKKQLAVFKDLMEHVFPELDLSGEPDRSKESTENSVIRLWKFRNEFAHFQPGGWSINFNGMQTIVLDAIDVIEDAILNKHQHRFNRFAETDAIDLIHQIRAYYETKRSID